MIHTLTIRRFKRFAEQVFDLTDSVVLVGPNDSGKSTLLQAITTWRFALDRWVAHRSRDRGNPRSGVPVVRSEFTPVPLREMNLLWEQRSVTRSGTGRPRLIEIVLDGEGAAGRWTCGMELHYSNPELAYARPLGAKEMDTGELKAFPPDEARDLGVVQVPALAGIAREEQRHDRGMEDLFVGQGRPGPILRNLLLEVSREPDDWSALKADIEPIVGMQLMKPIYAPADPYIICEFRIPGHRRPLDLSSAGAGALQVILLFAFLRARRASVLLLDEPDAHQHRLLQRQVFQRVREVASRSNGQVIAATHSEILLRAAELTEVTGLFGAGPRALATAQERQRLETSLGFVETTDLLDARERGAILYVENRSDEEILREWARVLGHRAMAFFARPNVRLLRGRLLHMSRRHFTLLRTEFPEMKAVCLLDGNDRDRSDEGADRAGFLVLQWRRYEIENYLLHPAAIKRFVERAPAADPQEIDAEFRRQLPTGTDLFGDHVVLVRAKASEDLLAPMLERAGRRTKKTDLYQLAAVMKPEEIHPEVVEKLDRIADELLPAPTS